MDGQSAAAQRAGFAGRAARTLAAAHDGARRSAAHVAGPLPAAQVPRAELVQREAPRAVRALQGRHARPAVLLLLRPYAVARRPSSPLPRKR
jgi:hypothetical protein